MAAKKRDDDAAAFSLLKTLAEQGLGPARHNLGVMDSNGYGASKDYVLTYTWSEIQRRGRLHRSESGSRRRKVKEPRVARSTRAADLRHEENGIDHTAGRWQMRCRAYATGIILFVACASLEGCAAIVGGAAYGVEKIYLAQDRSPIYVTENDNAVVGCVFMMDVKGKRLLGGPFLEDQTLERVIADLTIEIYEGGANVLLIKEKSKGFWGSSVVGKGYRCTTIPAPPSKPIPK